MHKNNYKKKWDEITKRLEKNLKDIAEEEIGFIECSNCYNYEIPIYENACRYCEKNNLWTPSVDCILELIEKDYKELDK